MALEFPPRTLERMKSVFGDDATVNGTAVRGVFSNAYIDVQGVEATAPNLLCLVDDVPAVAHGHVVTVPARGFTGQVAGIQPDGDGWVLLILFRTA